MAKKRPVSWLSQTHFWSNAMNSLFDTEVKQPVMRHSGTTAGPNNELMGFPFDIVREHVIGGGRANFSTSFTHSQYGKLTCDEMVLLYCFVNMRQHFYSALANFRLSKQRLTNLFESSDQVYLIDVGCGPATAGLAFAELFPGRPFRYYGVDRSVAMRNKARSMMLAGKATGLVHAATTTICRGSWRDLPQSFRANSGVILNFSFFFGSPFLTKTTIRDLAGYFTTLKSDPNVSKLLISYTNTTHDVAAVNYREFLGHLGVNYDDRPPFEKTVKFWKSANRTSQGAEIFMREIYEVVDP